MAAAPREAALFFKVLHLYVSVCATLAMASPVLIVAGFLVGRRARRTSVAPRLGLATTLLAALQVLALSGEVGWFLAHTESWRTTNVACFPWVLFTLLNGPLAAGGLATTAAGAVVLLRHRPAQGVHARGWRGAVASLARAIRQLVLSLFLLGVLYVAASRGGHVFARLGRELRSELTGQGRNLASDPASYSSSSAGAARGAHRPAATPPPRHAYGNDAVGQAFQARRSNVQVRGSGTVSRILSDDLAGGRHQRFILTLASGQRIRVAHNIDLSRRIEGLRVGDTVDFYGEYEWEAGGGVVHWTHRDPAGRHPGGWLRTGGRVYE